MNRLFSISFLSLLLASAANAAATLQVEPMRLKPGDPAVVSVHGTRQLPKGQLGTRPLHFYAVEGGFEAITGLPVEADLGPLTALVDVPGDGEVAPRTLTAVLEVVEPDFPTRELTVAKEFVETPPEIKKRIRADQHAFHEAFTQPFRARQFQGPFELPRKSRVTAPFGDLRTFNGEKKSQHYGLDLDGRVGDPIHAAQKGTVVMARECYSSGNTIILSHGGGLFTAYFHMSAFAVGPGEQVRQGQLLGKVGRTGRVTGPHLHWGAKIDGLYVDPVALTKLSFEQPVVDGPIEKVSNPDTESAPEGEPQ